MRNHRGSRREILVHLCAGERTVAELAAELAISRNAVRKNLEQLEQDGLVGHETVRRGVGKPAFVYRVTPDGEVVLSRAYLPLLRELLDVLRPRMPSAALEDVMRQAGGRLALRDGPPDGDGHERIEAAAELLRSLGGVAFARNDGDGSRIECTCCAIGAIVGDHPLACKAMEALLSEYTRLPVREDRDRTARPRCRFDFTPP